MNFRFFCTKRNLTFSFVSHELSEVPLCESCFHLIQWSHALLSAGHRSHENTIQSNSGQALLSYILKPKNFSI